MIQLYIILEKKKIREMDFVKDCATINSKQGGSVEEITVFIEKKYPIDDDVVLRKINDNNNISKYEMPSEYYFLNKIPYKENGKIDYSYLLDLYKSNTLKLTKK